LRLIIGDGLERFVFTDGMPFLTPNQAYQGMQGSKTYWQILNN